MNLLFSNAKKLIVRIVKPIRKIKLSDKSYVCLRKRFKKKKIVKGFTTNPSLIRKAGAKDYESYCKKILKICKNKPVSVEVFADDYKNMMKQAITINNWGKNVYVKIPVVNSKGAFTGLVLKELSDKGIKLNITAVYTFEQTKKIYQKLNKKTKSIISIFAGRMADKGKDPLPIFKKSISLTKKNKNIEILWASTREAYNYTQAKQINCDIITMPPKVINQINGFGKSFKSMTLDTVKSFLIDSKKSRFSL